MILLTDTKARHEWYKEHPFDCGCEQCKNPHCPLPFEMVLPDAREIGMRVPWLPVIGDFDQAIVVGDFWRAAERGWWERDKDKWYHITSHYLLCSDGAVLVYDTRDDTDHMLRLNGIKSYAVNDVVRLARDKEGIAYFHISNPGGKVSQASSDMFLLAWEERNQL